MDFQIPPSLDGLDLDALTELESRAVAAFDALRDDPALDADGLVRLRELAAFVQSVRTEQARIEQAAEQVASELDDLTATVHGAPEGGDGDGDEGDGGEAEEPAEETPAEEPAQQAADAGRRVAGPPGGPPSAEAEDD